MVRFELLHRRVGEVRVVRSGLKVRIERAGLTLAALGSIGDVDDDDDGPRMI